MPGGAVELTGLALAAGATTTATFAVDAGCAAAGGDWTATARTGPASGDALALLPGTALGTAVDGACSLRFAPAPAAARVGAAISGTAFDPAAPPVAVEVRAAGGAAAAGAAGAVRVALAPDATGPGVLGGTTERTPSAGRAAFPGLTISAAGSYRLTASAPGAGTVTSDAFNVEQVAVPCTGTSCAASVSNATTTVDASATTTGGPGFLSLSLNVGPPVDCAGYKEFSPDWVLVNSSANVVEKLVTFKISYRTLLAGWQQNGLSLVQACFSAPYTFATRTGQPVRSSFDGDGDGVPEDWFTGLLPECKVLWVTRQPPCVKERRLLRDGIAVVARLPGGAIDPKMRG